MKIRFDFLHTGYDDRKYYWEFAIMYRKMIIITLSVFLVSVSTTIQVLLVLIVAYLLQVHSQTYTNPVFNQLEKRSIVVAATTIYCGFTLLRNWTSTQRHCYFALIVLVNAYFLVYWMVQVCGVVWRFAVKRFQCLHRLLIRFSYQFSAAPARVAPSAVDSSFFMDRSLGCNSRVFPPLTKTSKFPTTRLKSPLSGLCCLSLKRRRSRSKYRTTHIGRSLESNKD